MDYDRNLNCRSMLRLSFDERGGYDPRGAGRKRRITPPTIVPAESWDALIDFKCQ